MRPWTAHTNLIIIIEVKLFLNWVFGMKKLIPQTRNEKVQRLHIVLVMELRIHEGLINAGIDMSKESNIAQKIIKIKMQ